MRGLLPDLASPHPLAGTLPGMLGGDDFVGRFCAALDVVLAPVFTTLGDFGAYLDPGTTPEDMLGWLAGWIGVTVDEAQPEQRRRDLVRAGAELLRVRGTVDGVRGAVEAVFGVPPEIEESGGASWSADGTAPLPGRPVPELVVRLVVPDPAAIDRRRLDALVAAVKPAHLPHRCEVRAF